MKFVYVYTYAILNVFLLVWCLWNAFYYTPYGWVMTFVISFTLWLGMKMKEL